MTDPEVFDPTRSRWADVLDKPSRKERRRSKNGLKLLAGAIAGATTLIREAGNLFDAIWALLESSEAQELFAVYREKGVDPDTLPVPGEWMRKLLFPHLAGQLCLECLRKGKVVNFVSDYQTGEIICPIEGTVQPEPFTEHVQRHIHFSYRVHHKTPEN